ncbi:MAG: RHS repeat-associated core domain-containing protein [Pseudomonadota bacterium]
MLDRDIGLTYAQARYYDQRLGRFYAMDPVGVDLNQPAMFNRYAYGNNNPYKFTDPDGEIPQGVTFGIDVNVLGYQAQVQATVAIDTDTGEITGVVQGEVGVETPDVEAGLFGGYLEGSEASKVNDLLGPATNVTTNASVPGSPIGVYGNIAHPFDKKDSRFTEVGFRLGTEGFVPASIGSTIGYGIGLTGQYGKVLDSLNQTISIGEKSSGDQPFGGIDNDGSECVC